MTPEEYQDRAEYWASLPRKASIQPVTKYATGVARVPSLDAINKGLRGILRGDRDGVHISGRR